MAGLWGCVLAVLVAVALGPAPAGRRVAVYFVGEPRTLNHTIGSLRINVFRPLKSAGYEAVVFVHTFEHPTHHQYNELQTLGIPVLLQKDPKRHQPPGACARHVFPSIHAAQKGRKTHGLVKSDYVGELLAQYYHRWSVDQMRQRYEEEHSVRFDWVYALRPGVVFLDPLPLPDTLPPAVCTPDWQTFGGVNDRFFAMPAALSPVFADLYNFLCKGSPFPEIPSWVQTAEAIHLWYFNRTNTSLSEVHNFTFVRVRDGVFGLGSGGWGCPFPLHDLLLNWDQFNELMGHICTSVQQDHRNCTVGVRYKCNGRYWNLLHLGQGAKDPYNGWGVMPAIEDKDAWWDFNKSHPFKRSMCPPSWRALLEAPPC